MESFMNLGERLAVLKGYKKIKIIGSIPTLLWQSGASESATASMFCYWFKCLLSTVQMHSFACHVCVIVCECEWGEQGHITAEYTAHQKSSFPRLVYCKYIRASSLCHTTLFPSRLKLMVKLTTLLTVFIFTLKTEARDYGKRCYIFNAFLWYSANHNALCQLANQSRLCLSEGGAL